MNRNFPSCIGEDAFEWVGDRNKTPHSLPDVTSSNTRYTCEDFPESEVLKQLGEIREQQQAMNNGQKSIQMDPAEPKGNGKANGEANGVANGEANGEVGLKI